MPYIMSDDASHWSTIVLNVNEIYQIIHDFSMTRGEISFEKVEFLKSKINSQTPNKEILHKFILDHLNDFTPLQKRAFTAIVEFLSKLEEGAVANTENCAYSTEDYKTLVQNIFGDKPVDFNQEWETIAQNTNKIFKVITKIASLINLDLEFKEIIQRQELMLNAEWNKELSKNNRILHRFISNKSKPTHKPIFDMMKKSSKYLLELEDFTKYTLKYDKSFSVLSHLNLEAMNRTFLALQKALSELNIPDVTTMSNGLHTTNTPWPAIERLAAIVARL
jgi:hypothetical protein